MATENITKKEDPAAAANVATGKRNREAVLKDIAPATNPNVPIRPTTNNDPGKPLSPEQQAPIAQSNSNMGIRQGLSSSPAVPTRPAGSPSREPLNQASQGITPAPGTAPEDEGDRDVIMTMDRATLNEYRRNTKLTEAQKAIADEAAFKFMEGSHPLQSQQDKELLSSAVNPNTPEYARQQQLTYQQGIQRAAREGLRPGEVEALTGFDQVVTRQKPSPLPTIPGTSPITDTIPPPSTGLPSDEVLLSDLSALAKQQGKDLGTLSEGARNEMFAQYKAMRNRQAQAVERGRGTTPATPATPATQQVVPTVSQVPTRGRTSSVQKDYDYFRTVATDRNASPEDREMAQGYLLVDQIKNDPKLSARYGGMLEKDIRTFERSLRSQARTEKAQAPHIRKARGLAGTQAESMRNLKKTNPKAYQLAVWREVLKQPQYQGLSLQLGF